MSTTGGALEAMTPKSMGRNAATSWDLAAMPDVAMADILQLLPACDVDYVGTPLYAGLDVGVDVTDKSLTLIHPGPMPQSEIDALTMDVDEAKLRKFLRKSRMHGADRLVVCGRWHRAYSGLLFAGNRCLWYRDDTLIAKTRYDTSKVLFPFDWLGPDHTFRRSFNSGSPTGPVNDLTEAVLGIHNLRGPRVTFDGLLWMPHENPICLYLSAVSMIPSPVLDG